MEIVKIKEYVDKCYTSDDGNRIFRVVKSILDRGYVIRISFKGIDSVTPSFVNSALVELLNHYSFDYIKKHLYFSGTNFGINQIIKDRFDFETKSINNKD